MSRVSVAVAFWLVASARAAPRGAVWRQNSEQQAQQAAELRQMLATKGAVRPHFIHYDHDSAVEQTPTRADAAAAPGSSASAARAAQGATEFWTTE